MWRRSESDTWKDKRKASNNRRFPINERIPIRRTIEPINSESERETKTSGRTTEHNVGIVDGLGYRLFDGVYRGQG